MTKASDNEFPSVLLDEQASAPTTPATGFWRVYAKSDGLYIVDDAGSETGPFGTGGAGGGDAAPEWISYLKERQADETGHTDDDFFTTDSSADYTAVTPSGTQTQTIARGKLNIEFEDQTLGDFCGFMKAITSASAPMTIETRVTVLLDNTTDPEVAIFFSDGTTSAANVHGVGIQKLQSGLFTTRTYEGTFGARAHVNQYNVYAAAFYLRAIWVSANTWNSQVSVDGVQWVTDLFTDESDTLTPTHIGFGVYSDATSAPMQASFDYLRVYDSDTSA